jgi:glucokinase
VLLAGDVGGTKTLLGLFERATPRPRQIAARAYTTCDFRSFPSILDAFESDMAVPLTIEAAAVGVAGPVVDRRARLTNIDWDIAAVDIAERCHTTRVQLLNDLEVMAIGVPVLDGDELVTLQEGRPLHDGHAAVIAAGTGLGQAYLHRIGGHLEPAASEGGHADFGARTEREMDLARWLRETKGRAEVEQVISGIGLVNLYEFTHGIQRCEAGLAAPPVPVLISQSALEGRCAACVEALDLFVSAYGSEAGNLALRAMATSGIYVGGGIAPKILPLLQRGGFMDAFRSKPPMDDLLARIPVRVIVNQDAGLIGAAVAAQCL